MINRILTGLVFLILLFVFHPVMAQDSDLTAGEEIILSANQDEAGESEIEHNQTDRE